MYIDGKDVPIDELREIWRYGSQSHSADYGEAPVYLKLLKTIRDINIGRPQDKRIKVLGGDPPFNWDSIHTQQQYFKSLWQRDLFAAGLAKKYGIDLNKKVLMIYGGAHYSKIQNEKRDSTHWTIDHIINRIGSKKMVTIAALSSQKNKLNNISLSINSICWLPGKSELYQTIKFQLEDGKAYPINEIYDAFYYIGPNDTWTKDSTKSIDKEYFKELDRRSRIVWGEGIDPKLLKD